MNTVIITYVHLCLEKYICAFLEKLAIRAQMEAPKFKVPFTAMCAGPTMAGKTLWIKKFILNSSILMDKKPDLVLYYYSEWQPAYDDLIQQGVTFIKGVPDIDELRQSQHSCTLMIFDDLMQELQKHPALISLFTRGCHHLGIFVSWAPI